MRYPKTAYICEQCRRLDTENLPHPGQWHDPGICDCTCRDGYKERR